MELTQEQVFIQEVKRDKPKARSQACPKFEKIPELRARNMTEQQRRYAGMNNTKRRKKQKEKDK